MDTNDAEEMGNLVVDLDGAKGVFTGTLIDYRMPCTASEDTTCQIVSNLSVWNEFLCWIQLELRELPETGRQIGLVHCAAGLDRVSRHPALVAELAEVLSIDQVEAADMVQRRFRSIEGLHEFMRLAGVVKGRVTCLPREDGRMQLDDLNDDCWAHVRRYLELDDLPYSSASPSSP
ncbi:uncharacterized protein LOC125945593 [Dermacentor silvarum]|uniref:uncharacterized protein LOC125945593 n=1 Tax=Dermacentor silvarum TaxID=543639 RepID=UPI002100A30A|nr:uncharacterized protein LOC125945593 [Dermacentor silvarum]